MDAITISVQEYANLMQVVQDSSNLLLEANKIKTDLDLSIQICQTTNSINNWVQSNRQVPPTVNIFNGYN